MYRSGHTIFDLAWNIARATNANNIARLIQFILVNHVDCLMSSHDRQCHEKDGTSISLKISARRDILKCFCSLSPQHSDSKVSLLASISIDLLFGFSIDDSFPAAQLRSARLNAQHVSPLPKAYMRLRYHSDPGNGPATDQYNKENRTRLSVIALVRDSALRCSWRPVRPIGPPDTAD